MEKCVFPHWLAVAPRGSWVLLCETRFKEIKNLTVVALGAGRLLQLPVVFHVCLQKFSNYQPSSGTSLRSATQTKKGESLPSKLSLSTPAFICFYFFSSLCCIFHSFTTAQRLAGPSL